MRYSNFTLKPAIVFYFRLWVGLARIQLSVVSYQLSVKNRGTIARSTEKLKITVSGEWLMENLFYHPVSRSGCHPS